MKINGRSFRTIWPTADGAAVEIIDQTRLPHDFVTRRLDTVEQVAEAIRVMRVRGAPLIGVTAAYGVALAMARDPSDASLDNALKLLGATRPTAINLRWALDRIATAVRRVTLDKVAGTAFAEAARMADEDAATNAAIGDHGLVLIRAVHGRKPRDPVNILTHCNAGWLACVDWGTALAPIYKAHNEGIAVHVWVDETRPRIQGALTAWELKSHGVPHTVIVDNAGGHLMQHGLVDLCIVGTDRTTRDGDVANKIGTYLKALAASDNDVPFYVGLPGSTVDWSIRSGREIPIEERAPEEVTVIAGRAGERSASVEIFPPGTRAANYAFDVTPARLVTGLITERGVCAASEAGLLSLFPERSNG
ncbi:MAG TPA: S-methyl-5-thioribose-1-phosphate isomerase [Alphaproteobacteria bacterium]|nr:S-methyl-5-thioribose-1-phosphate isomerase [Alphaproteobacteria bacterium]